MFKIKVSSNRRRGRLTQVMNESFSDLAHEVNGKILERKSSKKKIEKLTKMIAGLEEVERVSKEIPESHRLKLIVNEIKALRCDLCSYLQSIK